MDTGSVRCPGPCLHTHYDGRAGARVTRELEGTARRALTAARRSDSLIIRRSGFES